MRHKLLNNTEIKDFLQCLKNMYPDIKCGLDYANAFELTISLILAAQCKDERVNLVRPILTGYYPTPKDICDAGFQKVYNIVKSISFPNNKAKYIIACCQILKDKYNGIIPNTMDELISLPGIGRKSANIILSECFGIVEGIAVDTHVTRIAYKLRLTNSKNVIKIEKDLMKRIPQKDWGNINHLLVAHGKAICDAKKPKCKSCQVSQYCRSCQLT